MADNIFYVKINRTNFEYDIQALFGAFYPERDVRVVTPESTALAAECGDNPQAEVLFSGHGAQITLEGRTYEWQSIYEQSEKRFKDGFKAFFYQFLRQHTGKSLPWGNLTGIRPTKIAYGMLEEGRSHEEIMDFFCGRHFVSEKKAALGIDIAEREREILKGAHLACRPGGALAGGCGRVPAAGRESVPADGCGSSPATGQMRGAGYSLYVGIPFCPTTCLYCSFPSYGIAAYRKIVDTYLDCLILEMTQTSEICRSGILDSVYIGGGTPTTLDPGQLDRLLCALKELFPFADVKEFTVEAGRADSITGEKLEVLRKHGVSRISINPQTMKQETLDAIGRRASVRQVLDAYAMARGMGFDNINMDLILGLPGEDASDVRRTMEQVISLAPDSLTVHSLAIKRASRMSGWIQEHGISMLKNTDETMEIAARGAELLGMKPYYLYRQKNMSGNFENVGYARPGKYGLYNILIMEEVQDIVALGAGSISKRVYPDGRIERSENVKEVAQYIERIGEMIARKRLLFKTTELERSENSVV